MYGCETWTLSKPAADRIEAFEMWCYRRLLRISWTKKVTNNEVLQRVDSQRTIFIDIKRRKLKYFGHIMRKNGFQRILMDGKVDGKRGRGRPRTSWSSNIAEWTGLRYEKLVRATQQRATWRDVASNPHRRRN